ncbi:hypothetical protein [Lyngbya aestuarii]|uniref:hypothetical protein n=1 Tax=Lyngbya aestuarii TaxID=118322 RepID=UPI00403D5CCC
MNNNDDGYQKLLQKLEEPTAVSIDNLSKLWAKKYIQNLVELDKTKDGRLATAQKMLSSLRSLSAHAWIRTESFLASEVKRHDIDYRLIDPWEISRDAYEIYKKALSAYADNVKPRRLSVSIASDLGRIRQKYTKQDPRLISFVSMQFHYTGKLLLEPLPVLENSLVSGYFKVIDDHLYMPLQRAYEAAAKHDYDSPNLKAVRKLLPVSSELAKTIHQRVTELYPRYRSYSGLLSNPAVQVSSIRDIEMFQVYLWVCILEKNTLAIQQELFPLCLMIYPSLKVSWELVRLMLSLLNQEIRGVLGRENLEIFQPYLLALMSMFSPEVFTEPGNNHSDYLVDETQASGSTPWVSE